MSGGLSGVFMASMKFARRPLRALAWLMVVDVVV
jgi:hypothetical protein